MPQGQVTTTPDDGLTTRQRRNRPLVVVHTGEMKGKSTAAFGLALRGWNQGWSIAVFQFVKSAKWKVGEEEAFRALGRVHEEHGTGGPVEWHKMGQGWSWARKQGSEQDHAAHCVHPEPDPHPPHERVEVGDGDRPADAQHAQIQGGVGTDEEGEADRMQGEHRGIGPDGVRLAQPGRQPGVLERRQECGHRVQL